MRWPLVLTFVGLAGACIASMAQEAGRASPPRVVREPVAGLPCEGCEAVFEGMPRSLRSQARIAPQGTPGQAMTVTGRVHARDGKPRAGVVIYAYQTDAGGVYPRPDMSHGRASDRHGALRGWAVTDAEGRYRFDTIRPGSYPSRDTPEHIHLHVIERGCATYYIDDLMFTDDPLATPALLRAHRAGRGGNGLATPSRANGRWQAVRDIRLGAGIPGYPACGGRG
jgi:protocatechuate 3,4-dioxygenase beta subunit